MTCTILSHKTYICQTRKVGSWEENLQEKDDDATNPLQGGGRDSCTVRSCHSFRDAKNDCCYKEKNVVRRDWWARESAGMNQFGKWCMALHADGSLWGLFQQSLSHCLGNVLICPASQCARTPDIPLLKCLCSTRGSEWERWALRILTHQWCAQTSHKKVVTKYDENPLFWESNPSFACRRMDQTPSNNNRLLWPIHQQRHWMLYIDFSSKVEMNLSLTCVNLFEISPCTTDWYAIGKFSPHVLSCINIFLKKKL